MLLTVAEIGERFDVRQTQVRQAVRMGRMKRENGPIPGLLYISLDDAERWFRIYQPGRRLHTYERHLKTMRNGKVINGL